MPKRIFDISRNFGLDGKAVLAKARALGIAQAKVVSSILDDEDVIRLEEDLIKAYPTLAVRPKPLLEGEDSISSTQASCAFNPADVTLVSPRQMKPCFKNRRVVEVRAGKTWNATLNHRIYSCPNTEDYDFILGASGLILMNSQKGARIPLEVCQVIKLMPDEIANWSGAAQSFRVRAQNYLTEIGNSAGIIRPRTAHRFYFLSTEPWPLPMQDATASVSETEWAAIRSIFADPDQFFQWPQTGELLRPRCIRAQSDEEHHYPPELIDRLAKLGLKPDVRNNGPAIISYLVSGGIRPRWGDEGWPIHHIYDGTNGTPHAVRDGNLFTHSAGLVAAHPIAHHMAHQSNLLKWLLRREAFLRFGFDPTGVFFPADDCC